MRPAGRSETDSLYFEYPAFGAPTPEARNTRLEAPVAVVGAGPVGMTAALTLASQGVRSVLFDNKATFNDGSRAICIARPSFYILEQLDAVRPFLEKSLGWTTGRTFYQGRQILEFQMPDGPGEKYRPMYNLQQQYIEQFLWEAVSASELIETRWQSEISGIAQVSGKAALTVSDPAGEYQFCADWILACDGARSSIRQMRGLRLAGENFEGRYVIADIQVKLDYPTIRRALFDPACRPGGTVLIHKQPDDIWRIDYQLRDDESINEAIREETVRASVASVLSEIGSDLPWQLEWWSVYSANTLALDDYRDGPVFFVGDSAHIVPIFGVRGLNNGLADAFNIGWKLGWVLNGNADARLLDSYSAERRAATLDVFANAGKSARFMTPNTYGWKLMRDAALSLALTHPFAGELANPRQMTAFTYRASPAVLADDPAFGEGPEVGALLPECDLAGQYLSDQLGKGFSALCFDSELAQSTSAAGIDEDLLKVLSFGVDSHVAQVFCAQDKTAYLIRPDRHIAGRWRNAMASQIIDGMRSITFQPGETC